MKLSRSIALATGLLLLNVNTILAQPGAHGLGGRQVVQHGELRYELVYGSRLRDIQLDSLENLVTGRTFRFAHEPMWEVVWFDLQTGELVHTDSGASDGLATLARRMSGSDLLVDLEWRRCRLASQTFTVQLTLRIPASGSLSEWTIAVDAANVTTHAVQAAEIALGILPTTTGTTYGMAPYRGTLLIEDPHELLVGANTAPLSAKLAMQLFPYYTAEGSGLYLAVHDPAWDTKSLHLEGDGRRYHIGVRFHAADLRTPGQRFVATAPLVVGTFEGDWFDAGQIYRAFALGQSWLARGPLKTRTDVPLWWKELELYESHTFDPTDDVQNTVATFEDVRAFYGVTPGRMAIQTWAWFDNFGPYQPLPGFLATAQGLAAHGIRAMPYVWSYGYDPLDPSYVTNGIEPLAKKDLFGQTYTDTSFPWRPVVIVDPTPTAWHDHVTAVAQSLGVDAIYFDNPFEVNPCFAASHGHRGYGPDIYGGFHELMQAVRSQMRVANPDFVIGSEAAFEGYIDASEWIEPDAPFMPNPIETDGRAHYVPLLESIYHDFAPVFYANEKADYFRAIQFRKLRDILYTLAEGFTLGRVVNSVEAYFEEGGYPNHRSTLPAAQDYVNTLRLYIDTRRTQKEFLIYGRFLRPMQTSATIEPKELHDPLRRRFYRVPVRSILSSSWKADDGRVGILLTNYRQTSDTLTYTLRFADADLVPGTAYDLVDASNGQVLRQVTDDFTMTASVPALGLRFFIVKKQP